MIYFTADAHFGHANIIGYTGRPWANAAEMNGALLSNIITTVGKTDTLYILGDFAFEQRVFEAYMASLRNVCGTVIFIKGNHDPKQDASPLALQMKYNKKTYYLCHYPWQTWRPNTVMLHGHCHGTPIALPGDPRQKMRYDVGVDTIWGGRKYYPVSIEQIEERIALEAPTPLMPLARGCYV